MPVGLRPQVLVRLVVDRLAEEVHGAIDISEVGAAGMPTERTVIGFDSFEQHVLKCI